MTPSLTALLVCLFPPLLHYKTGHLCLPLPLRIVSATSLGSFCLFRLTLGVPPTQAPSGIIFRLKVLAITSAVFSGPSATLRKKLQETTWPPQHGCPPTPLLCRRITCTRLEDLHFCCVSLPGPLLKILLESLTDTSFFSLFLKIKLLFNKANLSFLVQKNKPHT